jgi:hypothetical protein
MASGCTTQRSLIPAKNFSERRRLQVEGRGPSRVNAMAGEGTGALEMWPCWRGKHHCDS